MNLRRLLQPKSIAVIGGHWALEVIKQCQKFGYEGDIWPVHPNNKAIEGLKVYSSVAELPGVPDAAFVGVNRELTVGIIKELAELGCGGAVCFSSGFSETHSQEDSRGVLLEEALIAASSDMPILGPNCYGFINYCYGALLWPDQHGGKKLSANSRGVAIIAQSSNLAFNLTLQNRELPLAYIMTVGNQCKVGLSQVALSLLDDPQVSCLGLYVEGFDSIAAMQELAHKAFKLNKPIAILKAGKSDQAQAATFSHTASLAGSYSNASSFIKRLGMASVQSVPALLDTLLLLHTYDPLPSNRLSAMVCSGGEASIMADLAHDKNLEFPLLPSHAKQQTQDALGPLVTVSNPLDFHTYGWGDRELSSKAFVGMLRAKFDLNILMLDFPPAKLGDRPWRNTAQAFLDAKEIVQDRDPSLEIRTALVSCLAENKPSNELMKEYLSKDLPCFGGFDEILVAAEASAQLGQIWEQWRRIGEPKNLYSNRPLKSGDHRVLDEYSAKKILSQYGLSVPQNRVITQQQDFISSANDLAYPLALKALGVQHKTELDAVKLDINTDKELVKLGIEMMRLHKQVMLEKMVENTVGEFLIGVTRDPQFGFVLTIAMGGVLVELLQESVSLLLPVDKTQLKDAIMSLKISALFESYRGQPAWDLDAVVEAAESVQKFVMDYQESLLELDINPLMIGTKDSGVGAVAADALIVLEEKS